MKTIPIALQLELDRSTARLATCMLVTRRDGNQYGFTTNRKRLTIDGVVYEPAASFNPTDIVSANNLDTDNLTIEGFLDSEAITEEELRAGYWDWAEFRIFQVNWASPSDGQLKERAGHFGQVTVNRSTFVVELLGLIEAYGTSIGDVTQPMCRNRFGDTKCGVNLTGSPSFTVTGTATAGASDFFTWTDTARTEADAYFDEGKVTFHYTQGDRSYEIKAYLQSGGTFVTKTPYAYDVAGVAYTLERGCRKRFLEDCVATYANGARFNGEPWLRGNDAMTQVGRHS